MPLNCVIVDDEATSIEQVSEYITNSPQLKLLKAFTSPKEALAFIKSTNNIDIVFMDVDMPFMNGFELGFLIREDTSLLIFITSHAKYALEAYDLSVDAYLLKPFNFSKFFSVVQRLCDKRRMIKTSIEELQPYLFVKSKEDNLKLIKIFLKDIIAIESLLNYIRIYTLNGKIVTHLSLKEAKEAFGINEGFIQIHRSFIIAPQHIISLENSKLTMSDGSNFTIGNGFKNQLNNILGRCLLKTHQRP